MDGFVIVGAYCDISFTFTDESTYCSIMRIWTWLNLELIVAAEMTPDLLQISSCDVLSNPLNIMRARLLAVCKISVRFSVRARFFPTVA